MSLITACGARTGLRIDEVEPAAPCVPANVDLGPQAADVMFVIDRSGSMRADLNGRFDQPRETWRWTSVQQALESAFTTMDERVHVGAKFFPDATDDALAPMQIACASSPGIDVASGPAAAPAILHVFDATEPGGGTPTASALMAASGALRERAQTARFIVLATDGAPNCNNDVAIEECTCTGPPTYCEPNMLGAAGCLDDLNTVAVIEEALVHGVPTFVLGIEDDAHPEYVQTLDRMAVAGGRARLETARRYYSARSETDLQVALDTIAASITAGLVEECARP